MAEVWQIHGLQVEWQGHMLSVISAYDAFVQLAASFNKQITYFHLVAREKDIEKALPTASLFPKCPQ